ncbi:hypothetical protein ACFFGV_05815 [Pontibacillus salicampi]|uniref:Negative regulator of sigma-X activity n=1 Tax=Pontibacillus salicampi TaxID=1449801 RepID=A0ABV6LL56_9BACI
MKRNDNYSDEALEDLLKKMPQIHDSTPSETYYERIEANLSDQHMSAHVKPKRKKLIPITGIAAAALFAMLSTPLWMDRTFDSANQPSESTEESTADFAEKKSGSLPSASETPPEGKEGDSTGANDSSLPPMENEGAEPNDATDNSPPTISKQDEMPNTKQEEKGHQENESGETSMRTYGMKQETLVTTTHDKELLATIGVPRKGGSEVVPISFKVPASFGSTADVYNAISTSYTNARWGLERYALQDVEFQNTENGALQAVFPEDYDPPATLKTEETIIHSLQVILNALNQDALTLRKGKEEGIRFTHSGFTKKITSTDLKQTYSLLYPSGTEDPLLLPKDIKEEQSVEKAITTTTHSIMNKKGEPVFSSLGYENVEENGDVLIITFADNVELDDDFFSMALVEGILMTAKSYNFTAVHFKGANVESVSDYHFTTPIQVPEAVNPKPFTLPSGS